MFSATPLPRFLLLYAGMFAAFGVASPFLPALLVEHGLPPGQLGVVLGAGTALRVLAGPAGGRWADRSGQAPWVLAALAALAAFVAPLYLPARGLVPLLLVGLAHAAVLAPLTPVADALAASSAAARPGFQYGWVRAAGSAAFIGGALLSGALVDGSGLEIVVWLNAGLLAAAALCALTVPNRLAARPAAPATSGPATSGPATLAPLFRLPQYWRLLGVAALVGGSHALHDAFAVIRWRQGGLTVAQCSALWSMAVAAEIVVFLLFGGRLLAWLGPARAMALAAAAGVLRWGLEAETTAFPVLALAEPLHGFTFALLHLSCVGVIAVIVPPALAATAQAFYATVALGLSGAVFTVASGVLYGRYGAQAFWAMALLCAAALPLCGRLSFPGTPTEVDRSV